MIEILCLLTSILVVIFILSPFVLGRDESPLVPSSLLVDQASMLKVKEDILNKYLLNDQLYKDEKLYKREWEQRQQFLINRYIDIARRLDVLQIDRTQSL